MNAEKIRVLLAVTLLCLSGAVAGRAGTTEEDEYLSAIRLFNQHAWDQARQNLLDLQTRFPNSRWRWAIKLRLADLETDPARAEKLYQEVITQKDNSEWAWEGRWGLATALYARGSYPQAREMFLALTQSRDVRRIRALYYSGLCALALNQIDTAREAFTEITDHHPLSEVAGAAMIALGDTEITAHHLENGRRWYQKYLQEKPEGELAVQAQTKIQALESSDNTPAAQVLESKPAPTPVKVKIVKPATAPVNPLVAPASVSAGLSPTFFVQVGAFSKIEYAQGLLKKLQNLGLAAFIQDTKTGKEPLHLVRVGAFATRAEAQRQAALLTQNEGMPTLVVWVQAKPHSATPPAANRLRKKP